MLNKERFRELYCLDPKSGEKYLIEHIWDNERKEVITYREAKKRDREARADVEEAAVQRYIAKGICPHCEAESSEASMELCSWDDNRLLIDVSCECERTWTAHYILEDFEEE